MHGALGKRKRSELEEIKDQLEAKQKKLKEIKAAAEDLKKDIRRLESEEAKLVALEKAEEKETKDLDEKGLLCQICCAQRNSNVLECGHQFCQNCVERAKLGSEYKCFVCKKVSRGNIKLFFL